jgi:hypothetical protein
MKHLDTNANYNFPIVTGTFLGKTISWDVWGLKFGVWSAAEPQSNSQ